MDIKQEKENLLEKLYYGDLFPTKEIPNDKEYFKLLAEISDYTERIKENSEVRQIFNELMEKIAVKEGMEAENQFQLGFKMATKLIIEGTK